MDAKEQELEPHRLQVKMLSYKAILADTSEEVNATYVKVNTRIVVNDGTMIPIDGVVVEGNCEVGEQALTCESFLVSKQVIVYAGTINLNELELLSEPMQVKQSKAHAIESFKVKEHEALDFSGNEELSDMITRLQDGYAGNPNNNNGWLEADDYLLRDLESMADEQMVGLMVDKIAEQMIVLAVEEVAEPMVAAEEQMVAPMIDTEEDLIALFGEDDDFEDDDSEGFDEEEVWEVNEEWLMAPVTLPSMLAVQPPSLYEVGGPSTAAAEGPSFPLPASGLPIPPVVSDAEVAVGVTIWEIGPRVFAIKGQIQVMVSQMVHVADRWEQALQAYVQQRDMQIQ
ncbi:reverse transcriptase domain-containing protein [Tanacetum coccineum]